MSDDVRETMTDDGRIVVYATDEETDEAADTDQWFASDTTVSGGDQQ